MIEVGGVEADGYDGSGDHTTCRLEEGDHLPLAHGHYEVGNDYGEVYSEEVVGHLYVVGLYLQGGKQGCDQGAEQVFPLIAQDYASNSRRNIGQSHHFPYMTCSNDDKEVAGESPHYSTKRSHPVAEVKGAQQDIESEHGHEDVPHVVGKPKVIGFLDKCHRLH